MGGPGSGRWADDETPVAAKVLDSLYRKVDLDQSAGISEFLKRLDRLRLECKVSSKQHQDLVKSQSVRRTIALLRDAEDRIRRLEAVVKTLEDQKQKAVDSRNAPSPPDGGMGPVPR